MTPGMINSRKASSKEEITCYLYVVPLMVFTGGAIVKVRTSGVVLALTNSTEVGSILEAVIQGRNKETQTYVGLLVSHRAVNKKGHIIANRTDFAVLDSTGDKIVKYHTGTEVTFGKKLEAKRSYTINLSRHGKPVSDKNNENADFELLPKKDEHTNANAMDVLSVSMLLNQNEMSYKRLSGLLGMSPIESTILSGVSYPAIAMRSLALKSIKTGVSFTFNLWGDK